MKFENFTRNKKGELTTKQIVSIIILIASFIIILFLLFRLNLGETTAKEICHNSVILKDKSGVLAGNLDCRTNYLCISGGKDCEGFSSTSKIKINLNEPKEEYKNLIMKSIADEMSDCWWMFGEGSIKYGGGFASTSVYCAICSIVVFDEKIQEQIPEITYSEFYTFLKITNKDESQTYLEYLYGVDDENNIEDKEYFNIDLMTEGINTKERQTIITGVDMNVKVLFVGNKDDYLNTFIIPTSETSSTECDKYITSA